MIKLTRIDDRLLHGQVALVWTPALKADCLIIANDKVANDDFLKMTLGFARPANARLLIFTVDDAVSFLNDQANGGLNIILIVNSVRDACLMAEHVPEIRSINFGGLRSREGSKFISKAIALVNDDIRLIRQLLDNGIDLEIRQVPSDTRQSVENLVSAL